MNLDISEDWKVRESTWKTLSEALKNNKNIYIWGSSGTGKTHLSKSLLSHYSLNYLYLNLIEFFTFKSLFKAIKSSIFSTNPSEEPKSSEPLKVAFHLSTQKQFQNFYVILDKADKLLEIDNLFIHKLEEFGRLSKLSLHLTIITESYQEDLFISPDTIDRDFEAIKVFLPEYSAEQLRTILRKQFDYGDEALFNQFFEHLHSILSRYTSKIFHYQQGFHTCYRNYLNLDPCLANGVKTNIITRELGNIENSFFQKSKIYKEYQHRLTNDAKLMVVCGFILSKNPPKLDAILLKGRKMNEKRKVRREFVEQVPPEKFSLQRLQAIFSIFYNITRKESCKDLKFNDLETPSFCSLFNTLTQKKLFVKVSKKDPLGSEKFMCTADFQFCNNLANELDIRLGEYVIDLS
jgi:hypothetical protein